MYPTASVCGQYFAHRDAVYFGLERIAKDQVTGFRTTEKRVVIGIC